MPALNNVSAAEKEDNQLGRSTTQAEEKEEDPDRMDVVMDEEEEGKGFVSSCILLSWIRM